MKQNLLGFLLMLVVTAVIAVGIAFVSTDISDEIDDRKEILGSRIEFENDTVMVVNYSVFEEKYTLSNGIQLDRTIINSFKIVE